MAGLTWKNDRSLGIIFGNLCLLRRCWRVVSVVDRTPGSGRPEVRTGFVRDLYGGRLVVGGNERQAGPAVGTVGPSCNPLTPQIRQNLPSLPIASTVFHGIIAMVKCYQCLGPYGTVGFENTPILALTPCILPGTRRFLVNAVS